MVDDPVPNIRFKVAKSLQVLVKYLDATIVQERIRPALETLQMDGDKDVKFYAQQALNSIA